MIPRAHRARQVVERVLVAVFELEQQIGRLRHLLRCTKQTGLQLRFPACECSFLQLTKDRAQQRSCTQRGVFRRRDVIHRRHRVFFGTHLPFVPDLGVNMQLTCLDPCTHARFPYPRALPYDPAMDSRLLIVVAVLASLMLAAMVFLIVLSIGQSTTGRSQLLQAAANLAAGVGATPDPGGNFSFDAWGRTFSIGIHWTRNGAQSAYLFTRIGSPDLAFYPINVEQQSWGIVLRRETKLDKLGKWILMNQEAQTGHQDFDPNVYVESDLADGAVRSALEPSQVRQLVLSILDLGFSHVILAPGVALVAQTRPAKLDHLNPTSLASATRALHELGTVLPHIPVPDKPPPIMTLRSTLLVLAYVLTVAALPVVFLTNGAWTPIDPHLYWSGVGLGLFLLFASMPFLGLLIRGHSNSLRVFIATTIPLILGLPLVGVAALVTLNGAFDSSKPEHHRCEVVGTRISSGKSTSYYVTLKSWRTGDEPIEFRVGQSVHRACASRSGTGWATVTVYAGLLGQPWYDDVRPSS